MYNVICETHALSFSRNRKGSYLSDKSGMDLDHHPGITDISGCILGKITVEFSESAVLSVCAIFAPESAYSCVGYPLAASCQSLGNPVVLVLFHAFNVLLFQSVVKPPVASCIAHYA